MNIFWRIFTFTGRHIYATSRSLLIYTEIICICAFSIAFGAEYIIDSQDYGGFSFGGLIISIIESGICGAVFGFFMWLTCFNPWRATLKMRKEKLLKKKELTEKMEREEDNLQSTDNMNNPCISNHDTSAKKALEK